MDDKQVNGIDLLKTIGACFLAPIMWIIGAMLGGLFFTITNSILTVIRPEIIQFFAAVIGTFAGIYVARISCDRWLKGYNPQVVFVVFAVLFLGLGYFEFVMLPLEWSRLDSYVQLLLLAFLSYIMFWKNEPIN